MLQYFKAINRLNDMISEMNTLYHTIAQRQGLSDSAMDVLYCVAQLGEGCPLSQVYKRNGGSRQTVNSALRRLEQEGVLFLQAAGGKSKSIWMTEKGRLLLAQKVLPVMQMENDILASWQPAEVEEYLRLSEQYMTQLRHCVQQNDLGE